MMCLTAAKADKLRAAIATLQEQVHTSAASCAASQDAILQDNPEVFAEIQASAPVGQSCAVVLWCASPWCAFASIASSASHCRLRACCLCEGGGDLLSRR